MKSFLYLMVFYLMEGHKKAFIDSNYASIISWPYKFRLFFNNRFMCIVRSNFRKYTQFVGRLFYKLAETTTNFYISMLFYSILAGLKKIP